MNRSGYIDDWDDDWWSHIRWRGAVASSIRGKRGQAFLRELIAALDALPEKRLIADALQDGNSVCAIGSVGLRRGIDMSALDPENSEQIAATFGIADPLVRELEYLNDEVFWEETPEERWQKVRTWAVSQLKAEADLATA